jgi:hypothetical protein
MHAHAQLIQMAAWRMSEMGRSEPAMECIKEVFGEILVDNVLLCGVMSIILRSNAVVLWFRKQLTTNVQVTYHSSCTQTHRRM